MRRVKWICLFFLIFIQGLSAQNKEGEIRGKVTDEKGDPIAFASVFIRRDTAGAPLAGAVSDSIGVFTLKCEQRGVVSLWVKFMGYQTYKKRIALATGRPIDVGTLVLKPLAQQLSEVTVVKRRPLVEQKLDRLVFHAADVAGAEGGDALDVLELTPRLLVSQDQVSIAGKKGVRFMVNGRIVPLSGSALTDYLRTIRAERIKDVEVITMPPAKYEAEGNSGLVNIVLKKPKNDSWNTTVQSTYRQAEYALGWLNHTFDYSRHELSFFSSTSYSNGSYANESHTSIYYPDVLWVERSRGKGYQNALGIRAGLDWDMCKNWTLGAQYTGSYDNPPHYAGRTNTLLNDAQGHLAHITTNGRNKSQSDLHAYNLHSIVKLDSIGRKISVDMDFLDYDSKRNRDFHSQTQTDPGWKIAYFTDSKYAARNVGHRKISNYAFRVDVEHPTPGLNLNYGFKFSQSHTDNDFKYYDIAEEADPDPDPRRSDAFRFRERIGAAYFSARKKFGEKWQTKLGLRGEHTQTRGHSITLHRIDTHSYFQLFPTAYLMYRPNAKHSYSLSYGRRIWRPGFHSLNPFKFYTSAYSYSSGNPDLKPVYTTNLEFSYNYNDFLRAAIWYTHDKDETSQVTMLGEKPYEEVTTRLNYFDDYDIGIWHGLQYDAISWCRIQMGLRLFYQHSASRIYPITPKSMDSFRGGFGMLNNFFLNAKKTFIAGFLFKYQSPGKSGDLRYNYERYHLNAFCKLLLRNRDLQISIKGNNLTKEFGYHHRSVRNHLLRYARAYWDDRYIGVSLLYRFGNKKIEVEKRAGSNREERNRLNS